MVLGPSGGVYRNYQLIDEIILRPPDNRCFLNIYVRQPKFKYCFMKFNHVLLLFVLYFFCLTTFSQTKTNPSEKYKPHTYYIDLLKTAKDTNYEDYLSEYDELINKYPDDITIKIEKCKLIGNAYYDEYDDYNLNYEEHEECIEFLYSTYPTTPEVILYKAENSYGESLEEVLEYGKKVLSENKSKWTDSQKSELYISLAGYYYDNTENYKKASFYINKAKQYNIDSLDYSLLEADVYLEIPNNEERALSALLENVEYDHEDDLWNLSRRASLLLQLRASEEALKVYEVLRKKDSSYIDNAELSKIFEDLGKYETARKYLVKDTVNEWNKESSLSDLYTFDLKYSDKETTLISYNKLEEVNYYDDFFGIKRLKLFFKAPFLSWTFSGFSHILILLFTIGIIFLIPYLWILPIYFLGKRKKKKKIIELKVPFDWGLKHFWLISFAFLFLSFILTLVFDYQSLIDTIFSDSYLLEEENSKAIVNLNIAFILGMFLTTTMFLNKTRIRKVFSSKIKFLRILSLTVAFLVINFLVLKFLKNFVEIGLFPSLDIRETIRGIITEYNFFFALLIVAILVPIYEEIMFRGIIFSSIEKYLGFWKANIIQASLFALVHQNLAMFIYFFIFGIVLGVMVKKSKGLLVGIIFHAINNAIALYLISLSMNYQDTIQKLNELTSILLN